MSRRFIAYADVLGFRPLVTAASHAELTRKYETLLQIVELGAAHGRTMPGPNNTVRAEIETATINALIVSDSIFLWTDEARAAEFVSLVTTLGKMLVAGFATGLPLRVGVTLGDMSVVDLSYATLRLAAKPLFGSGLVEAVELEEAQEWSGATISRSAVDEYEQRLMDSAPIPRLRGALGEAHLVDYEVPLKVGRRRMTAISWSKFNRGGVTAEMVEQAFTMHHKTVDTRARTKLTNTLDFLAATSGAINSA